MCNRILIGALLLIPLVVGCNPNANPLTTDVTSDTTTTGVSIRKDDEGRTAKLLSAFFGLDDSLPGFASNRLCRGAAGKDGMPVIFSHEVDFRTLQMGDFRVSTASGEIGKFTCITMLPATDPGELRTALFVGNFGGIDDPPAKVEVIGNLLSIDGKVNFKGASIHVTALKEGPKLIFAESVPENEWYLERRQPRGLSPNGSGCPKGTKQIVRAVWAGGVTKPGGDEVDDKERAQYRITVKPKAGPLIEVTPFALGDLGDNDNNHKLCIDVLGEPQSISFAAGFLTDPREDLNPETSINVSR